MHPLQWDPFEPSSHYYMSRYYNSHLIVRHGAEEFKNIANRECNKINLLNKSDLFKYVVNVTGGRGNGIYWSTRSLEKLVRLFYTVGWHEGTIPNGQQDFGFWIDIFFSILLICDKLRIGKMILVFWSTNLRAKSVEKSPFTQVKFISPNCVASVSENANSTAPEAIVKTVKTILECVKSRLEDIVKRKISFFVSINSTNTAHYITLFQVNGKTWGVHVIRLVWTL